MGDETISSNGEPGTEEAEALAAALNHSAERVQTLWFSFLTFMLYLAVAIGTTTHRMLFLESPLKLPVLNIDLPLLGFYILTPVIFVVFHFYMLLNLVLLARTAKSFEDALVRAIPEDGEARENFRMRIENTLFVQLLVGGRLERKGINAKLLRLMALISLALAPVALMLMFEIKFLPYHSWQITWLHRVLLALDLALVWTLWPGYRSGWGVRLWPKRSWRLVWPGVLSAMALAYAVMVATFPEELMYELMYVATNWRLGDGYDLITPTNVLSLSGEDLIDEAKLAHIIEKNEGSISERRWVPTLSLFGRDLTGANLESADIRHVEFGFAILNRAKLDRAWAKGANFNFAQFRGAKLGKAQLQGVFLRSARLQGAELYGAQLQGADLKEAQLQGADLGETQLQGADLGEAQLQAADLKKAQLQGASLFEAQLQGASLGEAQLQGALFGNVLVWRADARTAFWKDTPVVGAKTGPEISCKGKDGDCAWSAGTFEALKRLITDQVPEGVPEGDQRREAMKRIEARLDPSKSLEGEKEMAKVWAFHERALPALEVYKKSLAEQWRKTGCDAEGAPYVLRALLARLRGDALPFGKDSPEVPKLATAFLDDAHCAGAHGLSEFDKAKLKEFAAPAAPQAPKP